MILNFCHGRVKVKTNLRQCAVVILRTNTITPSVCLKLTNYPCWVLTIEPIIQVIISGEWQLFTGSTRRILGTTTGGKGVNFPACQHWTCNPLFVIRIALIYNFLHPNQFLKHDRLKRNAETSPDQKKIENM